MTIRSKPRRVHLSGVSLAIFEEGKKTHANLVIVFRRRARNPATNTDMISTASLNELIVRAARYHNKTSISQKRMPAS